MVSSLRGIWRLFYTLLSPSDLRRLDDVDVLLVCGENDFNQVTKGKSYNPLILSVIHRLKTQGYRSCVVTKGLSVIEARRLACKTVHMNKEYLGFKVKNHISAIYPKFNMPSPWLEVLNIAKPSLVLAIQPPPDLNNACGQEGVKIYDLQHGIIEPNAYYNAQLKTRYGDSGLPNGALCWDSNSKIAFDNALPGLDCLTVGNLWISRFLEENKHDHFASNEVNRARKLRDDRPAILITLTWKEATPQSLPVSDDFKAFLLTLQKENWQIIVRFHPVHVAKIGIKAITSKWLEATNMKTDNEKVAAANDIPLPALLKVVQAHATDFSASALEASLMGVPTVLFREDEQTNTWFGKYVDDGEMMFFNGIKNDSRKFIKKIHSIGGLKQVSHFDKFDSFISQCMGTTSD